MWDEQGGGKYGGHSVVKWPQKKTIWNISFGSVTMDEGHIARGENKFTDTFDGAFALGFTKNNMTATPLMQGPSVSKVEYALSILANVVCRTFGLWLVSLVLRNSPSSR